MLATVPLTWQPTRLVTLSSRSGALLVVSSQAVTKIMWACMATAALAGLLLVIWIVFGASSPAWAATEPSTSVVVRLDPAVTLAASRPTLPRRSGRWAGQLRHRSIRHHVGPRLLTTLTGPIERSGLTDKTEPIRNAGADPAPPANPVGPAQPTNPVGPVNPAPPANPVGPAQPTNPVGPAGSTRIDNSPAGRAECSARKSDRMGIPACPSNPPTLPVPTSLLDRASPARWRVDRPTELAVTARRGVDPACDCPSSVKLRPGALAVRTVVGAQGQDVASFPAQARYLVASPSDHGYHPQRPLSIPPRDGPTPLLPPGSSGPSGSGAGPGGTGSTGHDGGGSSFHSIGLAVIVSALVLRSLSEIRASFARAALQHGSFLPSRLERPG